MTLAYQSLYEMQNMRRSWCDLPEYVFEPKTDVPFTWGSDIDGTPFTIYTLDDVLVNLRTRWRNIDVFEVNRILYQSWNDTCLAQNPVLIARFKDDPDAAFHFKLWVQSPSNEVMLMLRESMSA